MGATSARCMFLPSARKFDVVQFLAQLGLEQFVSRLLLGAVFHVEILPLVSVSHDARQ